MGNRKGFGRVPWVPPAPCKATARSSQGQPNPALSKQLGALLFNMQCYGYPLVYDIYISITEVASLYFGIMI